MDDRFVYFDLGNVLVYFDHDIAVRQVAELSQCPPAQVQEVLFDSLLQNEYETGLVDSKAYCQIIRQTLSIEAGDPEILEAMSAIFSPNDSILEVLHSLRKRSVPMGILSNTCDAHWQWIARKDWPMLRDWFEFAVLSFEVGSMKPDAGIYAHCESRVVCPPTHLFFVDDKPENVQAAAKRGWTTHQFTTSSKLQNALEQWLDG